VQDGAVVGYESKSDSPLAERGTNLKVQEIMSNVGCVYSGLGTDPPTSVLPSNASQATNATDGGMEISTSEQPRKQHSSIRNSLDRSANKVDYSFELLKQNLPRISTELGMQIDFNQQQNLKHESSICLNRDPESNEIECSFELLKHDLQRISTELGMRIDCNKENLKQDLLIRFNLDPDSNVSESISFWFDESFTKHDLKRISTELGIQINHTEQDLKHGSSIHFNLDPDSNLSEQATRCPRKRPKSSTLAQTATKHDLQRISTEAGIQMPSAVRATFFHLSVISGMRQRRRPGRVP
jgi:hypothetical protein